MQLQNRLCLFCMQGCFRLWSQLLLITTSLLLTDVHNYYTKLAICIHCQEMSITLSPNKHGVPAEASYHTSCSLSQLMCGWIHHGTRTRCTFPYVKIKHHSTFQKFKKITQEPQMLYSSSLRMCSHPHANSMLRLACFTIGSDVNAE